MNRRKRGGWRISRLGVCGVVVALLVWLASGSIPVGAAGVPATVVDLGNLPGTLWSTVYGVNPAGAVVGRSGDEAALWSPAPGGGYVGTELGPGSASAIAPDGTVVGWTWDQAGAVLWRPNGRGGYDVEDLPVGTLSGRADAISPNGLIAGSVGDNATFVHAAVWIPRVGGDRTLVDLGTLPSASIPDSWGQGVNAAGVVVGQSYDATGQAAAAIWQPTGGGRYQVQELAGLPGSTYGNALGIGPTGVVVGFAADPSFTLEAVIWRPTGQGAYQVTDIGALSGGSYSAALGISPTGVVAGYWGVPNEGTRAAVWRPDGRGGYAFTDLGTLPGGALAGASAISATGLAAGWSGIPSDGSESHATLWRLTAP